MDIQQIRDFAQSLDSTDRALFAHELRKLAGEIDGVGSKGQVRGKTQEAINKARETIETLKQSSRQQREVINRLANLHGMLDDE
jgi:hypothetical protein